MTVPGDFFGLDVPFLDFLGIQGEEFADGRSRISLDLRPELMNSFEVSHGGVVMTMLDIAMAMAARSAHGHGGAVMTVDMSLNFMRPAKGRIVAEGRVMQRGRSLNFCEAEAWDESGALVAKAIGTFKLRRSAETAASAKGDTHD